MERSQLIYVVTVAECGSVTRAAEKLHLITAVVVQSDYSFEYGAE
ncbi:MAG: LysR family transcriptional regulator [Flavonifractor plautii]